MIPENTDCAEKVTACGTSNPEVVVVVLLPHGYHACYINNGIVDIATERSRRKYMPSKLLQVSKTDCWGGVAQPEITTDQSAIGRGVIRPATAQSIAHCMAAAEKEGPKRSSARQWHLRSD